MAGEYPGHLFLRYIMMINPVVNHDDTSGVIRFNTHFDKPVVHTLTKMEHEAFFLSYTAVNALTILPAYVSAVWSDYLQVFLPGGRKVNAMYNGGSFLPGQVVYVVENVDAVIYSEGYSWIALSDLPHDIRCIYVNLDVYSRGEIIKRLQINSFSGNGRVINYGSSRFINI